MEKKLKVVHILNEFKIVINAGSESGIKLNQRYLLYNLGEEVFDPDTNESLGCLELVKGTGKVVHVQQKMSTIESDSYHSTSKRISKVNPLIDFFPNTVEETELEKEHLPFENPKIGDLLKRIN